MQRFHFPLEKVLHYRARLLETEQARLNEKLAQLRAVEAGIEALNSTRRSEERRLHGASALEAGELQSLAAFLRAAAIRLLRLEEARITAAKALEEQRERVLKARREHRLLERLRDRRLAEWKLDFERELQQTADENFASRWMAR